jgi:glucose-1-phosphate cytidylyltransferase
MKAVILAGGLGTRLSEETQLLPKPMIEIGGKPIIWHIMKIYSHHGINEFIICCGYKGYVIKEYFANYFLHMADVTIDLEDNSIKILNKSAEPWKITLVDTGEETQTGGRLKRIANYIDDDFCMTYGDGLSAVDIKKLIEFHKNHKKIATITAVKPPGRFGAIELKGTEINSFVEKPQGDGGWINGGFFVLNPKVFNYINDDKTLWEKEPLEELSKEKQIHAFIHDGFWQPMDTLRDKRYLEILWESKAAPWKCWEYDK